MDKPQTTRNSKVATLKIKDVLDAARDEVESLTTPKVDKRRSRLDDHSSLKNKSPGSSALNIQE